MIKICGLTRPEDVDAAIAAGADLLGFILVPGTPRAVDPANASWIRTISGAETVGICRNAPLAEVVRWRAELDLDRIQLHGDEPDDFLEALETLGTPVLRRVPVAGDVDWLRIETLAAHALPLIDPGAGDGRTFDWDLLAEPRPEVRFGLAGGLTPENVGDAIRRARPWLVDVSSGVERSPGIKDAERIAAFVARARAEVNRTEMRCDESTSQ